MTAPHAGAQAPSTRAEGALLHTDGVSVVYNRAAVAVHGVSIAVRKAEIVALLGPNGAGKTTTMRSIGGFLPGDNARVSEGEVYFEGRPITGLQPHRVASRGITLVRERDKIFRTLTVEENLRVASARSSGARTGSSDAIRDLFPILEQRRHQVAGYLSGGERQMLGLAMALQSRPQLLMADEISLGIAPALVAQLMEAIVAIRDLGTTVLLVEQNAVAALRIADYLYVLENGRVAFEGTRELLSGQDHLRDAYLGVGAGGDDRGYRNIRRYKRRRRW